MSLLASSAKYNTENKKVTNDLRDPCKMMKNTQDATKEIYEQHVGSKEWERQKK